VFTSGGTAANLSALVTARDVWRKEDAIHVNQKGIIITSIGAHSSISSMADVIDVDVIKIESEEKLLGSQLQDTLDRLDAHNRERVFAVVATSGTTNAGIIDDLDGISDVCKKEKLWFHVDGAYGGAALVVDKMKTLFKGLESANSFTIDPHKWLFTPYDCGAVIYRDPQQAKETHSQEGSYLDIFKDEGAHGFNPADYQIQLTRRLRGMPLWFSLAMHGTDIYKKAVGRGIELARIAGEMITTLPHVELVRPPSLSCVLFRRIGWSVSDYTQWTYENHRKQYALVTPTKWKNLDGMESVARFCFINPDTTIEDIQGILKTME
ncbi:MAG: aminotransferase class V-fold PLP-dependent enzyme, partial [Saprospiraceae bacterium]|nr:aminotransferase class V-fold PLP-dependent enzyme [Saprospiraceae bacterium]